MRLMELFHKLTPAEFAQIQELLLLEKDISGDLDPFIEKLCSDEVLEAWRHKRWTLKDMLFFYHQGILTLDREELLKRSSPISAKKRAVIEESPTFFKSGLSYETTCLPPILPSKSSEEMGVASEPLTFLKSDSSEEILALAKDSAPSSTKDLQQRIELPVVKKVSFALESDESAPISCFSMRQLQQLNRKTRNALEQSFVKKAFEDGVIRREDFSSIWKLNNRPWAISYIFSEEGLEDLKCSKITLAQLALIPCKEYLDALLTPHAQEAIKRNYISIDFIARIWFRLRKRKIDKEISKKIDGEKVAEKVDESVDKEISKKIDGEKVAEKVDESIDKEISKKIDGEKVEEEVDEPVDKELVSILLSPRFLTCIGQNNFDLMGLYHKIYKAISESLYFEKCMDGCYDSKTDLILRTFLLVWVEGLKIFCSDNAQRFFSDNSAQGQFFNRLWYLHAKKKSSVRLSFQRLESLQLAFSDEGYWAISHRYLTFSDCDRYENNVVKTYIRQLKKNSALRDVIEQAQLPPEVILDCYTIRFQLGYDSNSDEIFIERYPGEYFDFFTTPIALQAFKENKICLKTTKDRKEAVALINRREEYIKKLEAYFEKVRQEYNMHFSFSHIEKKEAKTACFALGKMCNQLQGINQKLFTSAEKKALYTPGIVSIFGSVEEWRSVLEAMNIRVSGSKSTHPLDKVSCKPYKPRSSHILGSPSALFQSQPEFPVEDEPKKSSNDIEETDGTFDVFSVALGGLDL